MLFFSEFYHVFERFFLLKLEGWSWKFTGNIFYVRTKEKIFSVYFIGNTIMRI